MHVSSVDYNAYVTDDDTQDVANCAECAPDVQSELIPVPSAGTHLEPLRIRPRNFWRSDAIILAAMWFVAVAISCLGFYMPARSDGYEVPLLGKILLGLAINIGFLPVHIPLLRLVWQVRVDPVELRFVRIIGSQSFDWREIEQVKKDGALVRSIVYKGKTIGVPSMNDAEELSSIIESAAGKPGAKCHRDFSTSRLGALFPLRNVYTVLWLICIANCLGIGMMAEQRPDVRQILVSIGVVLLLTGTIAHVLVNQSRARSVRLSRRGLGLSTAFARFEIAWSEMDEVFANAAKDKLELRTKQGNFQLGSELSDFAEIAGIIEVNQARVRRGHIIGN